MVTVAGLATACAVTPEGDPVSSSQEISKGDDGPPDPPDPRVCANTPDCTFGPNSVAVVNPLQRQLLCGSAQRYTTGAQAGFLGGIGSFCPDTPAVRSVLRTNHKHGYVYPYCDDCITIPAGKLFAFWSEWSGPGCPSGCEPRPFPGGF